MRCRRLAVVHGPFGVVEPAEGTDGLEAVKVLRIMIPILGMSGSRNGQWWRADRFLCARSQMLPVNSDNLKNLGLPVEPPANPIRPTLRDGH